MQLLQEHAYLPPLARGPEEPGESKGAGVGVALGEGVILGVVHVATLAVLPAEQALGQPHAMGVEEPVVQYEPAGQATAVML